MSRYPLQLPTLQNWSCHNCGGCCRQHGIEITPEEQQRIEKQNWHQQEIPESQPLFIIEPAKRGQNRVRLAHQPDGACVFLLPDGKCRIHSKFGEKAKPLACRIYPYAFHPAGNKVAVSLRFSCPSVAANRGQPILKQESDIQELAQGVVTKNYRDFPVPKITDQVQLDWSDTLRIVKHLDLTLAESETPITVKLLRGVFWMDVLQQTRFGNIRGERLEEVLTLIRESSAIEVPDLPAEKQRPTSIGWTQFRLLGGIYARHDTASTIDTSLRGRFRQLSNAFKLARGRGIAPTLHADLKEVSMAQLEEPSPEFSADSEEMLTRYFRIKVQGMHFFGKPYYDYPLADGFFSLALVLPVVMWLARWRSLSQGHDQVTADDVLHALTIADHQHGYSETLSAWESRRRVKNMMANGDLSRFIIWFAGDTPAT